MEYSGSVESNLVILGILLGSMGGVCLLSYLYTKYCRNYTEDYELITNGGLSEV